MKPFDLMKLLQNERGVSQCFPITHLVTPSVFATHNRMFGSVIHLRGVPFETSNHEILNKFKRLWHQSLLNLGDSFLVFVTQHRHKEGVTLSGAFQSYFLQEIDDRYFSAINQQALYTNDIYLTILIKGKNLPQISSRISSFVKKFSFCNVKELKEKDRSYQQECLQQLQKAAQQLVTSLSDFGSTLVGNHSNLESEGNELLSFLSLFLNGGKRLRLSLPSDLGLSLIPLKTSQQSYTSPLGHLAYYLSSRRISFGRVIEFHSNGQFKEKFAVMLSIKHYPTKTCSTMTNDLLKLPSEYVLTNSFVTESREAALKRIARHRCKMRSVNDAATSQIEAFAQAQDLIASNQIRMGFHHSTLMLLAETLEQLDLITAKAIYFYARAGLVVVRETIGQEPSYWAQIPGNVRMIARSALITSENFVDFCPLHNYRIGEKDSNHLGSAVTILKTSSHTPYFFNFHVRGERNSPSKGHATLIGGNGSGKTVAMAFLDAQLSRYGGRTFVFDRDCGLALYLQACNGYYAILSPEHADAVRFNPFQLPDNPSNRKFCRQWMLQLIKEEGESTVSSDIVAMIVACVDYVFEELPAAKRQLSNAASLLPINFPRWSQLRRWLRAAGHHSEGEYAYLFDNVIDDFTVYQKMGFDMTHFLEREPSNVLVALTMYLFYQLERSLDGNLVTILMDEGWQYLNNFYWQEKLKKWLPTLRKLNCHLVLATQSPITVIESPLRHILLDNVATHLYFANPQANREQYQQGFNLTDAEYLTIKRGTPAARSILIKQEHESCLCYLDLSMISDLLPIFSGNHHSLRLCHRLQRQYGKDPQCWLEKFKMAMKSSIHSSLGVDNEH